MKKIIRLTESDLTRIVRRVIKEQYLNEQDDSSVVLTLSFNLKYNIDPTTKQKYYIGHVYYTMPINTTGPQSTNPEHKGNLYAGIDTIVINGQSYKPTKETLSSTNVTGYFPVDVKIITQNLIPYVGKGEQTNVKNITAVPKMKTADGTIVGSSTPHNVHLTVTEQQGGRPATPTKP
jgi:hypothetical protein